MTFWEYDIAYEDGPYVGSRVVATLAVAEQFVVAQEVFSPSGDLEGTVTVTLDPVSEDAWQREAAALLALSP